MTADNFKAVNLGGLPAVNQPLAVQVVEQS